jgi:hypothetical protein
MSFENEVKFFGVLAGIEECALCASLVAIRDDAERLWDFAQAELDAAPNVAEFRRRRELERTTWMQADAARLEFEKHRLGHFMQRPQN